MARVSHVIVLFEDARHRRLIYRYLKRLRLENAAHFEPPSSGRGCGEQWVRERYANSVRAFRARHAKTALIVAIDADTGDRNRRLRQLEHALSAAQLPPRTAEERIVHLIPKRNIETWILNLNGSVVDEETDFSREGVDEMVVSAANALFDWTRPNAVIPPHCVPSLRLGIEELKRLEYEQ